MRTRLAVALVALLCTACGSGVSVAAVAAGSATLGGTAVTYCADGGKAQTLDVYEPPGSAAARPLLIVVHGGSWAGGDAAIDHQSQLTQVVVNAVLARGFVVASLNYRLAPVDHWPAQITDVRCAVRYLRATASRWNVDPRRFAALGDSAGGQLVSLDALSAGQDPQWNSVEHASESSAVQAVVDCWGLVDLTAPGWGRLARGIGRNVFQVPFGTPSAILREASPVAHVRAGAPPFLIIQGTADTLVPAAQSAELAARLRQATDTATLLDVAHAGHGLGGVRDVPITPSLAVVAQRTVSFLLTTVGRAG